MKMIWHYMPLTTMILERIVNYGEDIQATVCKALHWTALQEYDLPANSLCVAISVHDEYELPSQHEIINTHEILRISHGLIQQNFDGNNLELSHFSVKDFLQSLDQDSPFANFRFDTKEARKSLAKASMLFLSQLYHEENMTPGLRNRHANNENSIHEFCLFSARLVLDSDELSEAASQLTNILSLNIIRQYAETICMPNESMVDEDSDIASVLSVVFSEVSAESSVSSSHSEIYTLAVLKLVDLLQNDDELAVLYPKAMLKLRNSRFQRNFARFLKQYSNNLEKEATNKLQRQAVGFIRHCARRTAREVAEKVQPRGSDHDMSRPGGEEISKELELNEWIESQNWHQNPSQSGLEGLENDRKPDDEASPKDDGLFDESDSSASSEIDGYSIRSLREIEHFLVSSQAFLTLRKEFRQWLRLDEGE